MEEETKYTSIYRNNGDIAAEEQNTHTASASEQSETSPLAEQDLNYLRTEEFEPTQSVSASVIVEKLDDTLSFLKALEEDFQSKLKYDRHKEKIIDDLHTELQSYKNDLIRKLLQPILMDVIHVIDDIHKLTDHYRSQDPKTLEPTKLLGLLESIPFDLENLLYRQGVEPFRYQGTAFDPGHQRAIQTVETNNTAQDKAIARSLRAGYEWEGKVLRREMVEVYLYKPQDREQEDGR